MYNEDYFFDETIEMSYYGHTKLFMLTHNQTPESSYKNLGKWNFFMGILHLVQGVAMWTISKENTREIFLNLPKPDPVKRMFGNAIEKWYDVNLGHTIAAFLFLSAAAHFITVIPSVYKWYIKNLKNKINYIRWYEYALSSSVMIYVISVLNGINDGMLLFALVGLNAAMNLFGASMEMHNSTLRKLANHQITTKTVLDENGEVIEMDTTDGDTYKPNWSHFVFGSFVGILPWIISAVYFFVSLDRLGSVADLPSRVKDALNVVKFIFPALFVFFNCFAINMVLQYKGVGKWKDYVFGEKVYIILSLVAKSFLAWFIWGGTLR